MLAEDNSGLLAMLQRGAERVVLVPRQVPNAPDPCSVLGFQVVSTAHALPDDLNFCHSGWLRVANGMT